MGAKSTLVGMKCLGHITEFDSAKSTLSVLNCINKCIWRSSYNFTCNEKKYANQEKGKSDRPSHHESNKTVVWWPMENCGEKSWRVFYCYDDLLTQFWPKWNLGRDVMICNILLQHTNTWAGRGWSISVTTFITEGDSGQSFFLLYFQDTPPPPSRYILVKH